MISFLIIYYQTDLNTNLNKLNADQIFINLSSKLSIIRASIAFLLKKKQNAKLLVLRVTLFYSVSAL